MKKGRLTTWLTAAAAMLGGWTTAEAAPDIRGIYVATRPLVKARAATVADVAAGAGASGAYIQLQWRLIEPMPGRLDFRMLDQQVRGALAAGRKISLSVIAGARSPQWLQAEGARMLDFQIARGGQRQCETISMAPPWDPVYQRRYAMMMQALARHVRELGADRAVRIVKLTGVARITEELRLPITVGRSGECGEADATARWRAAGYSSALLIKAWSMLANSVSVAFPTAVLAQDILERNDLPADSMQDRAEGASDLKQDIIRAGLRLFPGRFAIQWDGLNKDGDLPATPLAAHRAGAILGWQSNMRQGFGGAGCNVRQAGPPIACSPADFAELLARGVDSGASYIELWPEDAARFPDAVAAADQRLKSGGGRDR